MRISCSSGVSGSNTFILQRAGFPRLKLIETEGLPAVRVGHPDVADLFLRQRMAVVALGRARQQFLKETRRRNTTKSAFA